jgi:hypothetical protein
LQEADRHEAWADAQLENELQEMDDALDRFEGAERERVRVNAGPYALWEPPRVQRAEDVPEQLELGQSDGEQTLHDAQNVEQEVGEAQPPNYDAQIGYQVQDEPNEGWTDAQNDAWALPDV